MCRDDHDLPHFSLYARSPSPSRSRLRRCEKIKIGRVGALMKRRSCCNGSVYAVVRMLPSTLLSPMRRNVKKWAYSPLTYGTPTRVPGGGVLVNGHGRQLPVGHADGCADGWAGRAIGRAKNVRKAERL